MSRYERLLFTDGLNACAGNVGYNFGLSSSSVLPSSLTNGSHIGYSRVKESIQGETAGYSIYEFFDQLDYQGAWYIQGVESSIYPAPITDRVSFVFGLPSWVGHYTSSGTLVQETTNSYRREFDEPISARTWKSFGGCNGGTGYASSSYQLKQGRVYLDATTQMLDGVSTTSYYTYGQNHLSPIKVGLYNSDGKYHLEEIEYAEDVTTGYPGATAMVNAHMIGIPLVQSQFVDGAQVNGSKVEFNSFSLLPEKSYQYWNILPPKIKPRPLNI